MVFVAKFANEIVAKGVIVLILYNVQHKNKNTLFLFNKMTDEMKMKIFLTTLKRQPHINAAFLGIYFFSHTSHTYIDSVINFFCV